MSNKDESLVIIGIHPITKRCTLIGEDCAGVRDDCVNQGLDVLHVTAEQAREFWGENLIIEIRVKPD